MSAERSMLRRQRHRVEDADDGEPLAADARRRVAVERVDAEPLGRLRAEHDGRVALGGVVEEAARRAPWPASVSSRSGSAASTRDAAGLSTGCGRCGARSRRHGRRGRRRLDRADPADHGRRRPRAAGASSPRNDWPGCTSSRLVPSAVELGQQVGPARRRDAEHRHHRRDADGDPRGRQRGRAAAGSAGPTAPTRQRRRAGAMRPRRRCRAAGAGPRPRPIGRARSSSVTPRAGPSPRSGRRGATRTGAGRGDRPGRG